MYQPSIDLVLEQFVNERRRVISTWRTLILLRRQASGEGQPLPTWENAEAVMQAMIRRRLLARIAGVKWVFRIDAPFARIVPTADEHVIAEAHPRAALSHFTAMFHHQVTDVPPRGYVATEWPIAGGDLPACGTTPDDWADLPIPINFIRRLRRIGESPVTWRRDSSGQALGIVPIYVAGVAVYVTDLERTLLDGLRSPDLCGGVANVFAAWRRAAPRLRVDRLLQYVQSVDGPLLRQRVGYLLEAVGVRHATIESWRQRLQRGGSLRLLANRPYSPAFSERWNLSLNAPPELLALLEAP